ncbi:hypothetical protein Tco_0787396, partial [Tanacetum coccineum]
WVSDAEPQSPEAAPHAPPSPDYVSGPEYPPSPDYVPGPEYPEYLALSDDDIPIEYQPLPTDALLTALSPGYIADSDREEDPEEDPEDDPEEDPADYPADKGYEEEEEESFGDDADDEDEEEASEEEDDDEEEEEHLSPADSSTVPIDDPVPSVEETKPFETDDFASTPPPPRLHRARISVRPQTLMAAATEALIIAIPSPPLPLPSLPLPLPAPSSPLLLHATDRREDVPEDDVPPWKRLYLTALTPREVGYGITDVLDDMVGDMEETTPTTLEAVNQRVADLATTLAQDTHETYVWFEDAQDDRAFFRAQINMIHRDRRYFNAMAVAFEREAMYAPGAWAGSEDMSAAIKAYVRALETHVATLMAQTSSLQT